MAGVGPQDLHALAQEYLAAAVASLNTIPTFAPGLAGAPERSFVSPGLPALDCCDQLTVHSSLVSDSPAPGGSAPGTRHRSARVLLVSLVASITRCIPGLQSNGDPPLVADQEEAAAQINADGWALVNHIFNLIAADQLFTLCGEVFWDGLRPIPPSGACAGWTLNLRVSQDGY